MEPDLNHGPYDQIEDRIRRLEAVISRARQRQSQRRNRAPTQIINSAGELVTINDGQSFRDPDVDVEGVKMGKRKAKELGENFYDCNICLEMATDPVLTSCGHLFCWSCFYKLSYADSNVKVCPVCKEKVTEEGITPVYGNASVNSRIGELELDKTDSGVPPRPGTRRKANASRIEGTSQQVRNWEASSTVQDMLQFGDFYGGLTERVQLAIANSDTERTNALSTQSQQETDNNQHTPPSHELSRLLVEETNSISSLSSAFSSAMDVAESIFADIESYVDIVTPE